MGKKLLDRAKEGRGRLSLRVYEKNTRAAAFYRREGFSALEEQTDAGTGEVERCMCWRSGGKEEPSC